MLVPLGQLSVHAQPCTLLYGLKVVVEGCLRGQFNDNVFLSLSTWRMESLSTWASLLKSRGGTGTDL